MFKLISSFTDDESGATLIEYALIAGLVSIVVASTLQTTGEILTSWFFTISGELANAVSS